MPHSRQQQAVNALTDDGITAQLDRFTETRASDTDWHPTSVESRQIGALRAEAGRRCITIPEWMTTATEYDDMVAELPAAMKARCPRCGFTFSTDDLVGTVDGNRLCMG